jgi:hypothetical protein
MKGHSKTMKNKSRKGGMSCASKKKSARRGGSLKSIVSKALPSLALWGMASLGKKDLRKTRKAKKGGMSCGSKKSKKGGMSCGTKKKSMKGGKAKAPALSHHPVEHTTHPNKEFCYALFHNC